MSFGNGISVNLLQLARAYTIFTDEGELMPVSLLKLERPAIGQQVFSGKTVAEVRAMLETVVLPGGTAPLAQVAGYRVAGKTGTSHKLDGGHYVNRYVASFVGMAPVSKPRLIVAVMVDEPAGREYYGGQVAAPAFSKVVGETLHLMNVPNDAPLDNVIPPPKEIIKEEV
jgi:cell division protein FtsI (penicillin-binding protein 3)